MKRRSFGSSKAHPTIILLWVTLFVVSTNTVVEGKRSFSREEYLEAKRLEKFLNRPRVKTVQLENGDIFDCVPINKQLALEHPSLKNHTIQMRPTFVPRDPKSGKFSHMSSSIGFKGTGTRCPIGTVSVRRIQVEDILRRSSSISKFGRKDMNSNHYYAVGYKVMKAEIYGTKAFLGTWNPRLNDPTTQQSTSQFWIVNGPERIEAGWISDNYQSTGCYNQDCPGFVLINPNIGLGVEITGISTYGGNQKGMSFEVYKDSVIGNWWLIINDIAIGYWPKSLFRNLADGAANRVGWGGQTLSPDPSAMPEMGSGHFPEEGYGKASIDWSMKITRSPAGPWEYYTNDIREQSTPRCYKIIEYRTPANGNNIFFGGPGGNCAT